MAGPSPNQPLSEEVLEPFRQFLITQRTNRNRSRRELIEESKGFELPDEFSMVLTPALEGELYHFEF